MILGMDLDESHYRNCRTRGSTKYTHVGIVESLAQVYLVF